MGMEDLIEEDDIGGVEVARTLAEVEQHLASEVYLHHSDGSCRRLFSESMYPKASFTNQYDTCTTRSADHLFSTTWKCDQT